MTTAAIAALLAIAPMAVLPPPPPAIAAHVKDGKIDTRDLSWLRGALSDADPEARATWSAARAWTDDCKRAQTARVRAELTGMGVDPVALPVDSYDEPNCWIVERLGKTAAQYRDWASFTAAAATAQLLLDTLTYGARRGAEAVGFDPAWVGGNEDAMWLLSAPVMDQTYRSGFAWRQTGGPEVSEETWPALEGLLAAAVTNADHRNTIRLKAMVNTSGWPGKTRVGERASGNAWLLVQHADADPAFQLKALRLMEPLVTKGEVSKRNYAYLYDRVMLKVAGKQRYATQMWCQTGERGAQPLETESDIDARRAAMDLEPFAEYLASSNKVLPPCPR